MYVRNDKGGAKNKFRYARRIKLGSQSISYHSEVHSLANERITPCCQPRVKFHKTKKTVGHREISINSIALTKRISKPQLKDGVL